MDTIVENDICEIFIKHVFILCIFFQMKGHTLLIYVYLFYSVNWYVNIVVLNNLKVKLLCQCHHKV